MMIIVLGLTFLLQNSLILVSDVSLQATWPRGEKLEKWLAALNAEKQTVKKPSRWPEKKDKAHKNPFKDSQESLDSKDSASAASRPVSHISSTDSFFNDAAPFYQVFSTTDSLIKKETEERNDHEFIHDAQHALIVSFFGEYVRIYQNALATLTFDASAFKLLLDKKRTVTVMNSRKGALKMLGFNTFTKNDLVRLLNDCEEHFNLWNEFVSAYNVHPTYDYLVRNDVFLKS